MAHTIDELVELQRAADAAQAELQRVQKAFGKPTEGRWAAEQHTEWETAWRSWSDLSRQVQMAVTEHAEAEGTPRGEPGGGGSAPGPATGAGPRARHRRQ
ncbi:hypothetical protein SGLAM104S_02534 [Streptomyces glaucescens]